MRVAQLNTSHKTAIIDLHFESWVATYGDIFSKEFIENKLRDDIEKVWQVWPQSKQVVGVYEGDTMTGFATYLMDKSPCYLDNFHIRPKWHGAGHAQALFAGGIEMIRQLGAQQLLLTVLNTNHRARAFYAKQGGVEGALLEDDMLGLKVNAYPVRWSLLSDVKKSSI